MCGFDLLVRAASCHGCAGTWPNAQNKSVQGNGIHITIILLYACKHCMLVRRTRLRAAIRQVPFPWTDVFWALGQVPAQPWQLAALTGKSKPRVRWKKILLIYSYLLVEITGWTIFTCQNNEILVNFSIIYQCHSLANGQQCRRTVSTISLNITR